MGHQLNLFLLNYGIVALVLVSLVKGIGVPLPVPSDVVVLVAATGSASGKLVVWQAFAAVLVGMTGGGLIQFLLARGPGRSFLYRHGPRVGLTAHRLDLVARRVEGVGLIGIAVVVVMPGLRTAAIPACGLTRMPVRLFAAGLTVGATAYVAFQFFVAYGLVHLLVKSWSNQLGPTILTALGVGALAATAAGMRHRSRHLAELHGPVAEEDLALRSHLCPLCRLTVLGDSIGRLGRHRGSDRFDPPAAPLAAAPGKISV